MTYRIKFMVSRLYGRAHMLLRQMKGDPHSGTHYAVSWVMSLFCSRHFLVRYDPGSTTEDRLSR